MCGNRLETRRPCTSVPKSSLNSHRVSGPRALAQTNLFLLWWLSDAPFCPTETSCPRLVCGLGLGFPALYSIPALTVPGYLGLCGKGQCHFPTGVVLDFSEILGPPLVPGAYQLSRHAEAPHAHQAFREGPWVGPWGWGLGGVCVAGDMAHSPTAFCRVPSRPCVCFLLPPGLGLCTKWLRTTFQPCLLTLWPGLGVA